MEIPPIISVKNLSKIYRLYDNKNGRLKEALSFTGKKYHRDHKALDNVSFEMNKGDCLAVIGKNGSGKSTLLQIIAGLLQPTSGSVEIKGSVSALVQLGATFNPEFTGIDNVELYASALGYTPKEIKSKLPEILRFADIGEFIDQKVKTYSSGMKSRLAFSVVINLEPEILIIDEVLSVGDMFFKQKCINKLKVMLADGLTLFFVSHSLNDVKALCEKALYLDKGKVVAFGDVEDITNLYQNGGQKLSVKNNIPYSKTTLKSEINQYSKTPNPSDYSCDYQCPNLSQSTERSGDNTIRYFKIAIMDSCEKESQKVTMFDDIRVHAYFTVNGETELTTDLGLVCRDSRGYDMFVINSTDHEVGMSHLNQGQNYIWEINIPRMLLVPGAYSLNIGAKPRKGGDQYYDRIFNACVFEVIKTADMLEKGLTSHGCFYCDSKLRLI